MSSNPQNIQPVPPYDEKNEEALDIGGGLPVIQFWAEKTLSPEGAKIWQTLFFIIVRVCRVRGELEDKKGASQTRKAKSFSVA